MQWILLKYDLVGGLAKFKMPKYSYKPLKPSLLIKIQKKDLKLKSCVQIIKKNSFCLQ